MEFIAGLSEWGYIGLFLSAFLSGSIIPLSSEVVLGILLVAGFHPWGCLLTATAGNWLGGVTCYYIGHLGRMDRKISSYKTRKIRKNSKMASRERCTNGIFCFSSRNR